MDDVILTGISIAAISEVKHALHSKFTVKDLGFLKYILGLEVVRPHDAIVLS